MIAGRAPSRRPMLPIAAVTLLLATTPAPADAARVRLRGTMEHYSASPAYLAVYVTDGTGKFVTTVQVFGDKVQYYPHLPRFMRGVGPLAVPLDGITGASVGAGRRLDVSVDIDDALIDAGYQLRVDSAVERLADEPAEIVLPLAHSATGQPATGRGLIAAFQVDF
jgi:hypothetical protein